MLTITKYGKSLCYRKDGNKLGRRKEQDILTKALERSMLKHEINSYAGRMGKRINCCVVGAGMSVVPQYASIGSMGTGIITVNGIPYNSMDEFDRHVSDKDIAQYIDFQFNARKAYKAEYRLEEGTNTYKPLEGVMLKPNKAEDRIWEAKKWEADNFYPHVVQLTEVPETIEDDKLIMGTSAWDRLDKKLSGGFKQDELCFIGSYMSPEEFTGNPSLTVVSELVANNNKNVIMVGLENQHDEVIEAVKSSVIGRGSSKPIVLMDVSLVDLMVEIFKLLPENTYPSVIDKEKYPLQDKPYTACVVNDDGDILYREATGYDTATEAFSMLYSRLLLENKIPNDNE